MTKTEIIAALPLIIITILLGINTNILLNIYTLPVTHLIF